MAPWLIWSLVISGGSALYWWKKANPGKSLNPMPPAKTFEQVQAEEEAARKAAQG